MRNLMSYICGVILVLLVAIFITGCSSQSESPQEKPKAGNSFTPTEVFNNYKESISTRNYENAWNELSLASQKSFVNLNNFKKLDKANIEYHLRTNAQVKHEVIFKNVPEDYKFLSDYVNETTSFLILTGAEPIMLTKEKNQWKIELIVPSICIISDELSCVDHVVETSIIGIVVQNKFDNIIVLDKIIFSGEDVEESCEVSMKNSITLDKGGYSPSLTSECKLKETGRKHFIDVLIQFNTGKSADIRELKGFIFG